MAWFFSEEPIPSPTLDRWLQRGFMLYGGQDAFGNAMNDLWLYDLTSIERTDVCRWYEIDSQASDYATYGGALVYRDLNREFVLMG